MKKTYTYDEALVLSVEYFAGDDLAARVFLDKYALRDKNDDTVLLEATPEDMHARLAGEFARIEKKKGYKNPLTYEEILGLFRKFKYIVPQGSPMSGIGNNNQIVSLSNCFVANTPLDSYGGILHTDQQLAQISKRRGGVGIDLSMLRPAGTPTSNAARTSTGIIPFMERFSNTIREVGQSGRRGALMLTLDITHPEAKAFATIKNDKTKVTGANISLKLTDKFMSAVEQQGTFTQSWPVGSKNPTITQEIDAEELWNTIIHSAWLRAEPGLLFWDNVLEYNAAECYADVGFGSVSTNPCVVGSTLVAVADGRNAVSIKQLTEEGRSVPVYSVDTTTGQTQIKTARNFRVTGKSKEIWKLTLDDGSFLLATPDHRILTKKLDYVELQNLKPGDSLQPFNTFDSNGYRQVSGVGAKMTGGAFRNRRQYRVIHEFYSGGMVDAKAFAIHHKNHDKTDDRFDNLGVMTHAAHAELHNIRGDRNPIHKLKKADKFEAWKAKNSFFKQDGENNTKHSGYTNEQLVEAGKQLYVTEGSFTRNMWKAHAKQRGYPQFLGNAHRFGSFSQFKSLVVGNHKVVSVERHSVEDVYDCTVDDNSNYCVITSSQDAKYVTSSGICIHNCSEIPLCELDACRLMVINLYSYVINPFTSDAKFDFALFAEHVKLLQRLMDDLVDLELEKIDAILAKIESDPEPSYVLEDERQLWLGIRDKCAGGRRTGSGVTAEGDMLAALGIKYGSDESIAFVRKVHKVMKLASFESSVDMAEELGHFPEWSWEKEKNSKFLLRIAKEDPELYARMSKVGRRNIANLTIAPTGSVSILTQTTAGIEPLFRLEPYTRRKKVNPSDKNARVDFVDASGDSWQEFPVYHPKVQVWMDVTGETDIKKSPWYGCTAPEINWINRVKLQAAAQEHIDHAISSTINLPEDVSEEEVAKIYMAAWKAGCKGITVYRDNCRTGVLVENKNAAKAKEDDGFKKRKNQLPAEIYHCTVNKVDYFVIIGIDHGSPYEVFVGRNGFLPKSVEFGAIERVKRGHYRLLNFDGTVVVDNVSKHCAEDEEALGRMVSMALRHNVGIEYVVTQLSKVEGSMTCLAKAISRALKKHVKDGTKLKGATCHCGSSNLVFDSGCVTCKDCGASKCN